MNLSTGFTWLHMCSLHAETRNFQERHTEIEPIIIDAMLADETRPIHVHLLRCCNHFATAELLTGLMGINIGGMPGVDNGGAFWLSAALCLAIIVMQVTLFRRLKWF
jgi:Mg2+ and Co2+ transporter CorA